jgi:hypothetical protein
MTHGWRCKCRMAFNATLPRLRLANCLTGVLLPVEVEFFILPPIVVHNFQFSAQTEIPTTFFLDANTEGRVTTKRCTRRPEHSLICTAQRLSFCPTSLKKFVANLRTAEY